MTGEQTQNPVQNPVSEPISPREEAPGRVRSTFWSDHRIPLGDSGGAWVVFFEPGHERRLAPPGDLVGIRMGGTITLDASSSFAREYMTRGDTLNPAKHLVFELTDVHWLGSMMISELMGVYQLRDRDSTMIWLCGLNDYLDNLITNMGCGDLFRIRRDLGTVLEEIRNEYPEDMLKMEARGK